MDMVDVEAGQDKSQRALSAVPRLPFSFKLREERRAAGSDLAAEREVQIDGWTVERLRALTATEMEREHANVRRTALLVQEGFVVVLGRDTTGGAPLLLRFDTPVVDREALVAERWLRSVVEGIARRAARTTTDSTAPSNPDELVRMLRRCEGWTHVLLVWILQNVAVSIAQLAATDPAIVRVSHGAPHAICFLDRALKRARDHIELLGGQWIRPVHSARREAFEAPPAVKPSLP